ncbi:hypothetical protein EAH73_04600 [Hymenobacter nivis]|uniref:Uncharacterized protein n=1 Tax=Hymenobacter nivis TaxID=1850093 RepID=A0A502H0Z0_9BACT|nr:hypothetical protein EAH73_04600 [Hymenobacter nivis]
MGTRRPASRRAADRASGRGAGAGRPAGPPECAGAAAARHRPGAFGCAAHRACRPWGPGRSGPRSWRRPLRGSPAPGPQGTPDGCAPPG